MNFSIRKAIPVSLGLALAGCSATTTQPQELEAVKDFIVAADLKEVDQIRASRDDSYKYVNDQFVVMPTQAGDYLVEFRTDCRQLRTDRYNSQQIPGSSMVDRRNSNFVLRSNVDTIRGCRIGSFYEITEEQAKELKALGDAPGENVVVDDAN